MEDDPCPHALILKAYSPADAVSNVPGNYDGLVTDGEFSPSLRASQTTLGSTSTSLCAATRSLIWKTFMSGLCAVFRSYHLYGGRHTGLQTGHGISCGIHGELQGSRRGGFRLEPDGPDSILIPEKNVEN